jgi:hypothetical protein
MVADDRDVDVRQVMLEIEQQLWGQQDAAEAPWLPEMDGALRDQLVRVRELAAHLLVEPAARPSTLPVIGPLVTWWRRQLHQLVLFYLNDVARQQSALGFATLRVLIDLATENQALRCEVAELRRRQGHSTDTRERST